MGNEIKAAGETHTGAMVALVPAYGDAIALSVDPDGEHNGEMASELHITLAFLGKSADISETSKLNLTSVVKQIAEDNAPFDARLFAVNVFNPNGDEPCLVLGVGGPELNAPKEQLWRAIIDMPNLQVPDNHKPWVPHMTLQYFKDEPINWSLVAKVASNLPPTVRISAIRIVFGDNSIDFPLHGEPSYRNSVKPNDDRVEAIMAATDAFGTALTGSPVHLQVKPTTAYEKRLAALLVKAAKKLGKCNYCKHPATHKVGIDGGAWMGACDAHEALARKLADGKTGEEKVVRHVRTTEGQRRFGQPIGSVIVGNGHKLSNLKEVESDFYGYNKYDAGGRAIYTRKEGGKFVAYDANDRQLASDASEERLLTALDKVAGGSTGKTSIPKTSTANSPVGKNGVITPHVPTEKVGTAPGGDPEKVREAEKEFGRLPQIKTAQGPLGCWNGTKWNRGSANRDCPQPAQVSVFLPGTARGNRQMCTACGKDAVDKKTGASMVKGFTNSVIPKDRALYTHGSKPALEKTPTNVDVTPKTSSNISPTLRRKANRMNVASEHPHLKQVTSDYSGYDKYTAPDGTAVYQDHTDGKFYDAQDNELSKDDVANLAKGSKVGSSNIPSNLKSVESDYEGYDKFTAPDGSAVYRDQSDGVFYDENDNELSRADIAKLGSKTPASNVSFTAKPNPSGPGFVIVRQEGTRSTLIPGSYSKQQEANDRIAFLKDSEAKIPGSSDPKHPDYKPHVLGNDARTNKPKAKPATEKKPVPNPNGSKEGIGGQGHVPADQDKVVLAKPRELDSGMMVNIGEGGWKRIGFVQKTTRQSQWGGRFEGQLEGQYAVFDPWGEQIAIMSPNNTVEVDTGAGKRSDMRPKVRRGPYPDYKVTIEPGEAVKGKPNPFEDNYPDFDPNVSKIYGKPIRYERQTGYVPEMGTSPGGAQMRTGRKMIDSLTVVRRERDKNGNWTEKEVSKTSFTGTPAERSLAWSKANDENYLKVVAAERAKAGVGSWKPWKVPAQKRRDPKTQKAPDGTRTSTTSVTDVAPTPKDKPPQPYKDAAEAVDAARANPADFVEKMGKWLFHGDADNGVSQRQKSAHRAYLDKLTRRMRAGQTSTDGAIKELDDMQQRSLTSGEQHAYSQIVRGLKLANSSLDTNKIADRILNTTNNARVRGMAESIRNGATTPGAALVQLQKMMQGSGLSLGDRAEIQNVMQLIREEIRNSGSKGEDDMTETKAPVITPGGRVGDNARHGSRANGENWVERSKIGGGALPEYIRIVRNGLMRHGHSEASATALAIGAMKKWARGGGNVTPKVRAAAAAALAQWEAMRGEAHVKKSIQQRVDELKTSATDIEAQVNAEDRATAHRRNVASRRATGRDENRSWNKKPSGGGNGKFDESKHPRRGGKFAPKGSASSSGAGKSPEGDASVGSGADNHKWKQVPASWKKRLPLEYGQQGPSVKAVQDVLAAVPGIPKTEDDGIYGTNTKNAIAAFQKTQGLKATGTLDEDTFAALINYQSAKKSAATKRTTKKKGK